MVYRILFFTLGLIIATLTLSMTLISLSLISYGYTYPEYGTYLLTRAETYLFPLGILLMFVALFKKR